MAVNTPPTNYANGDCDMYKIFTSNLHYFSHIISSNLVLELLSLALALTVKNALVSLPVVQFLTLSQTFNPLPDNKILEWSKLKQIADDILKCI